jgi:hypothetical protein
MAWTEPTTSSSSAAASTAAASRAMRRAGACRSAWPRWATWPRDLFGLDQAVPWRAAVSGVFRVPPGARGADRARDAAARHAAYQLADALRPAAHPTCASTAIRRPRGCCRRHAVDEGAPPGVADPAGAVHLRPLGGRKILPGTRTRRSARRTPEGAPLQDRFEHAPTSIPTAGWRIRGSSSSTPAMQRRAAPRS